MHTLPIYFKNKIKKQVTMSFNNNANYCNWVLEPRGIYFDDRSNYILSECLLLTVSVRHQAALVPHMLAWGAVISSANPEEESNEAPNQRWRKKETLRKRKWLEERRRERKQPQGKTLLSFSNTSAQCSLHKSMWCPFELIMAKNKQLYYYHLRNVFKFICARQYNNSTNCIYIFLFW